MRKFLSPILNVINLILVSVAWGLSNQPGAVYDAARNNAPCGTFYQIVWGGESANILAIIAFFLFCVACFAMLVTFLPLKVRKFIACAQGLMFIGAGVLLFLAPNPKFYDSLIFEPKLSGAYIAMLVLILVAGAFSLCIAAFEFLGKKESK